MGLRFHVQRMQAGRGCGRAKTQNIVVGQIVRQTVRLAFSSLASSEAR